MGTTNAMGIPYPESTDAVANGASAMQSLAEGVDAKTGLVLVRSETFSTQDPYDLTGIFSSSFKSYKIFMDVFSSVGATAFSAQFLSGTNTPYTINNYYRYGFYMSGPTFNSFYQANTTDMFCGNIGNVSTQRTPIELTVFMPNETQRSYMFVQSFDPYSGLMVQVQHQCAVTNSFTGLRFDGATGNVSGRVQVYGLRA